MQLSISEESTAVREMFERFFAAESTTSRVRSAEPLGFDAEMWRELVALEVPFMRVSAEAGGSEMSLLNACLIAEQAGRRLASVPLAETMVTLRALGRIDTDEARGWIGKVRDGAVMTLALSETTDGQAQLVAGGAVAAGILTFDGGDLAIEIPEAPLPAPLTLGGAALGMFTPGQGKRHVLAGGANAASIWLEAVEEWKILTAAALIGLSQEALTMAAAYACEREAFGQPIGANQGIAHPLANDVIDADGAGMFLWRTLSALADGSADAGALVSMLSWWASRTATKSVAHAIHTFGGYGLSTEYDIQLYHRRAKAWALALGDPHAELIRGGRRLLLGDTAALPSPGMVEFDFSSDGTDHPLAAETRAAFGDTLDPDRDDFGEQNFEAHNWEAHRALGRAGLLFPEWPIRWGGREADADAARAAAAIWQEVGYAGLARGVTGMAGALVQKFGQPALQDEVLLRFGRGDVTSCLGFTEPSAGSDVFAAKTRAVREGDEWVINGQKMFTSGAELASFVLLLARTNPDVPKHKGLTLFLAPLDRPGVEIQPVHTFMDERTNATFYADLRIEDRYRIGEVDGGAKAMAAALSMEQGGSHYHHQLFDMIDAVTEWARTAERDGAPMIEHPDTLARLARVYAHARISEGLAARAQWTRRAGLPDQAYGPASKIFATQAFIDDSADLLDLAAPASLVRGNSGLGLVEKGYRHATATSIYGGTSEVLRSMVAERRLGLPRSRA